MNAKTRKALEGSIEKWRKIAYADGEDKGPANCPLCTLFYGVPNHCAGCPVHAVTEKRACKGTPYSRWVKHREAWHKRYTPWRCRCFRCRALAKRELKFLRSLHPVMQDAP